MGLSLPMEHSSSPQLPGTLWHCPCRQCWRSGASWASVVRPDVRDISLTELPRGTPLHRQHIGHSDTRVTVKKNFVYKLHIFFSRLPGVGCQPEQRPSRSGQLITVFVFITGFAKRSWQQPFAKYKNTESHLGFHSPTSSALIVASVFIAVTPLPFCFLPVLSTWLHFVMLSNP